MLKNEKTEWIKNKTKKKGREGIEQLTTTKRESKGSQDQSQCVKTIC